MLYRSLFLLALALTSLGEASDFRQGIFPHDESDNNGYYIDMEPGPQDIVEFKKVFIGKDVKPLAGYPTFEENGHTYQMVRTVKSYFKYRLCDRVKKNPDRVASMSKWIDYAQQKPHPRAKYDPNWQLFDNIPCYLIAGDHFIYLDPSMDLAFEYDDFMKNTLSFLWIAAATKVAKKSIPVVLKTPAAASVWRKRGVGTLTALLSAGYYGAFEQLEQHVLKPLGWEKVGPAYYSTAEDTNLDVLTGNFGDMRYYLGKDEDILGFKDMLRTILVKKAAQNIGIEYIPAKNLPTGTCGSHYDVVYKPNLLNRSIISTLEGVKDMVKYAWYEVLSARLVKASLMPLMITSP